MQLLIDKGWKNHYNCMCGGQPKQYWSHAAYPSYEIRIRPRRNSYTLWQNNHMIVGPDWNYNMESTLTKYGING